MEVEVRPCRTTTEWEKCADVQARVGGRSSEDLIPTHLFVLAAATGGQILGAFLDDRLIGYCLAFVALDRGNEPYLHSYMVAVLPEFRDRGVGRRLKLAQREDGIKRGFDHMEWTFDPLEIRNGYFYLVRLGAVARRYERDCYGTGMPTGRLVAEWWWTSRRVESVLSGKGAETRGETSRIAVPAGTLGIETQIRSQFEEMFRENWTVVGVERKGDAGDYILERGGPGGNA